ncbi:MAG: hypothetical protein L6R42_004327 [Xanthoria sp. 1 TBL-2021]|nr:MAG: hypothetical protein L6R42_004327 [Xanthoria sp. 1 TBL-2021]
MIISAVFGTAILAIHGVSGAVMPIDTTKRNEALEVRSEAIEDAHSPAFKREAPASVASATPKISSMVLPDLSSTTTCVHTGKGFIECDDVMNKRENAAAPSMKSLEKRAEDSLPLRDSLMDDSIEANHLKTRTADSTTAAATAFRGCNGKGTAFYFTNDSTKTLCNGELVKGSELYHHYVDPNAVWNTYWMQQCFEFADCPGGAHWGP